MTHETTVHGVDAQLTVTGMQGRSAGGEPLRHDRPAIAADVAADGIDEWLTSVAAPDDGETDVRAEGLTAGETLHVHATDVPDGTGEWLVSRDPSGVTVVRAHQKATLALRGGASDLLLVLLRRLPPDAPGVAVHGDPAVLGRWLAATRY